MVRHSLSTTCDIYQVSLNPFKTTEKLLGYEVKSNNVDLSHNAIGGVW